MKSRLVDALGLRFDPVAVILTDERPEGALQFQEGRWGCVAATLIASAKGRTAVFDRKTFGCPGGGTGLGFGDQYQKCGLPLHDLLSNGNVEAGAASGSRRMAEGEHYFKTPETVDRWLAVMPMTEVPAEFVMFKPFSALGADEKAEVLVFLVDADQLSALVVMSDYSRGCGDSVIARFGAACQSILWAYDEAGRAESRAVIGFFDISQRRRVDAGTLSFTVPWALFQDMEADVGGSFLETREWQELLDRHQER
jgi:uncharacterized protein (DUF169 family)